MEYKTFQLYRDIAIDVLKHKKPNTIDILKAFLCTIPSPKHTEQILMAGILHFAQYDYSVFSWIIIQQNNFKPTFDLLAATRKLAITRLSSQGWMQGKDFTMVAKDILVINPSSQASLETCCSQHELRLIKTMININP